MLRLVSEAGKPTTFRVRHFAALRERPSSTRLLRRLAARADWHAAGSSPARTETVGPPNQESEDGEGRLARGGIFTGPDGNSRTAKPRISSATTYLAAFIQPLLPLRSRPCPENRESEMKGQVFWAAGPIP